MLYAYAIGPEYVLSAIARRKKALHIPATVTTNGQFNIDNTTNDVYKLCEMRRRQMLRQTAIAGLAGLLLGPLSLAADQDAADDNVSIVDAIVASTPQVNFRYRYEFVSDDDFDQDANASNIRFRLNYGTGKWRGWSGFGEFDYIDNDDSASFAVSSTATLGARAIGNIALGDGTLTLTGELATQSDVGDNPVSYTASYYHVSGDWGSEVDLAASRSLGDRYSLLLKGAFFSADDAAFRDVTKIWVQLIAGF